MNSKIEQTDKIDFDEILEETAKETKEREIKNTEKVVAESEAVNAASKLENKTIQNTAKKSLNTKNLGLFAIGAVALAGTAGLIAHEKNKKKDKQNKVHYNEKRQEELSDIDYNNDLQYANQITNFSKGHSTYSLG